MTFWHRDRSGPAPIGHPALHDRASGIDLAVHTDRLSVPAGTVLERAGSTAREVLVVVSGEVRADADDCPVRLGPGMTIGADEVLAGAEHDATYVAHTDVEVLVIGAPAYRSAAHRARIHPVVSALSAASA